ncbi:hypothetical protein BO71DRAFT_285024, partial [Aspergillus ellipticus CBS 707.79]
LTTSSGRKGSCPGCGHLNEAHSHERCAAPYCRRQWKRCQAIPNCNGLLHRICKTCPEHP